MEATVRIVVDLLRREEYDLVAGMCVGPSLPAAEMRYAVDTYGRTVSVPPPEWWALADVVEVRTSGVPKWHVAAPFWTVEEGRSDLSIELHL
ncbi:MAG: hypothetical protein Q7T71_00050, partial [Herbiconiux sp.]|nr:hypothetical protein [Herbiconiux sp.]